MKSGDERFVVCGVDRHTLDTRLLLHANIIVPASLGQLPKTCDTAVSRATRCPMQTGPMAGKALCAYTRRFGLAVCGAPGNSQRDRIEDTGILIGTAEDAEVRLPVCHVPVLEGKPVSVRCERTLI